MRPIRTTHIGFSLSRLHGMNVAIKWTGTCYNIKKLQNVRTQLIEFKVMHKYDSMMKI